MKTNLIAVATLLCAISLGSCEGKDGANGSSQLIHMTKLTRGHEACPEGGLEIAIGYDIDGDGLLDTEERIEIEYLCKVPAPIPQDGQDGHDGHDGKATLFVSLPEDPGEHCEYGGIVLIWGVDENEDGELTVSEYSADQRAYVCNGNPGLPTLITLSPMDPSAECQFGGIIVRTGMDDNKDGVMQSSEIDNTEYICHGGDGMNALVAQETEPPGANCTNGGTAIHSGLDQNRDGVLDTSEREQTTYLCN